MRIDLNKRSTKRLYVIWRYIYRRLKNSKYTSRTWYGLLATTDAAITARMKVSNWHPMHPTKQ